MRVALTRGVKLGHPAALQRSRETAAIASRAAQVMAKSRAEELRVAVNDARANGRSSLRQIADHFNALGITTPAW